MSKLAELESAVANGDLARAAILQTAFVSEDLSDEERERYNAISAFLRPDRRAKYVAVFVGMLLLAISIKLFFA